MSDKKENYINEEKLEKVSGGAVLKEDREWMDDVIWYCVENNYSWNDVVDKWFPDLEPYCERVNATREDYMKITPQEMDQYMMQKFFDIGERYLNGERRNGKKKKR